MVIALPLIGRAPDLSVVLPLPSSRTQILGNKLLACLVELHAGRQTTRVKENAMRIQIRKHGEGLDVIYAIENWDDYVNLLRARGVEKPPRRYRILVTEDAREAGIAAADDGIAELFHLTRDDVEFSWA